MFSKISHALKSALSIQQCKSPNPNLLKHEDILKKTSISEMNGSMKRRLENRRLEGLTITRTLFLQNKVDGLLKMQKKEVLKSFFEFFKGQSMDLMNPKPWDTKDYILQPCRVIISEAGIPFRVWSVLQPEYWHLSDFTVQQRISASIGDKQIYNGSIQACRKNRNIFSLLFNVAAPIIYLLDRVSMGTKAKTAKIYFWKILDTRRGIIYSFVQIEGYLPTTINQINVYLPFDYLLCSGNEDENMPINPSPAMNFLNEMHHLDIGERSNLPFLSPSPLPNAPPSSSSLIASTSISSSSTSSDTSYTTTSSSIPSTPIPSTTSSIASLSPSSPSSPPSSPSSSPSFNPSPSPSPTPFVLGPLPSPPLVRNRGRFTAFTNSSSSKSSGNFASQLPEDPFAFSPPSSIPPPSPPSSLPPFLPSQSPSPMEGIASSGLVTMHGPIVPNLIPEPNAMDDPMDLSFTPPPSPPLSPSPSSSPSSPLHRQQPLPSHIETDPFTNEGILGQGTFGTVSLIRHSASGEYFALKKIWKCAFDDSQIISIQNEVNALSKLQGDEGILHLHCFYEDENSFNLLTEYCSGGSLLHCLHQQGGRMGVEKAKSIVKQVAVALCHCHEKHILHRDIKLENILVQNVLAATAQSQPQAAQQIKVKVADFGLSLCLSPGELGAGSCGSPEYMAPEVWSKPQYDYRADVWSLGVMMYIMLYGRFPFVGTTTSNLQSLITTSNVNYASSVCGHVIPNLAIDLMKQMLTKDVEERPWMDDVLEHPFFA